MAILEIWGKESLGIDFMQSIFSNQIHQCPPFFFKGYAKAVSCGSCKKWLHVKFDANVSCSTLEFD